MAVRKGGDIIAEFLVKEKIPYVFGICGHGNVGLLDSLYEVRDRIKLVSPRHEQTAAHMADGFFRVSHRPAATLTSTGPGSANLIMALAVAQTDSSAVFSITANVPTSQFNRGPFQELNRHHAADFNNVIKPVVKRSFQPTRVEMLPLAMRQAATTMTSGRPGPVNLDVPYNLFIESGEVQEEPAWDGFNSRRSGASEADVARTVDWLLAAERPVIFIGHGVTLSEAGAELTALAERLSIPVISSPNGMGCLHMGSSLSLGFIGRNGAYPANQAGRHADLVLAIGARFDDRSASSWMPGYSWNFPHTRLIHVDVDHGEIGRNYVPDLGILADAKAFLQQLLSELDRRKLDGSPRLGAWAAAIAGWRKEWEAFIKPGFETHTHPDPPGAHRRRLPRRAPRRRHHLAGLRHPPQLVHAVLGGAPPADHAQHLGLLRHGLRPQLDPGRQAGRARPALRCRSAATAASPWCRTCCARRWSTTSRWCGWCGTTSPGPPSATCSTPTSRAASTAPAFYQGANRQAYNPDFAAWAKAAGVTGHTVTRSQDFAGVLAEAVASGKPALIDVHVDADIRPPGTGAWELPPIPPKEPVFGAPWRPDGA